ncbi:protein kinase [Nonomuraea sp. NPDC049152]|uniref:protein kinase domain-containing protein n=1 Tax=Nonomuraea sp. NPDC049152 TaxID=3154350 RepID=UPI0033F4BE88
MQILDALSVTHRHGVVHRDIKPANLFLINDGRVKVCDFGISRLADATKITATGSSAGTPLYMAPEQIEGHTVDERTDLYAFGCAVVLATGALLLLFLRKTAGRWLIAAGGAGMTLQAVIAIVSYSDVISHIALGFLTLTVVAAAAAMLVAVLPSTGRWCLRRS